MKQKTETMLCAAFMDLLKKCPFSKITIQRLAGQCGVNRQTFYYHFDNIYDLMARAFEYELIHEGRMYEGMTWESSMRCFLAWLKENRVIIKNILAHAEIPYLRRAMYPIISKSLSCDYFQDAFGRLPEKEQDAFACHFLTIGLIQYVLEWVESDFRQPVEDMVLNMSWLVRKVYS